VFGEGLDRKEDDVLNGKGIYETSKICEDYIARSFYNVYSLPIVVTRASNIYGEGDNNSRIIPNTIRDLKTGTPPIIFKEQKGNESLREYIYVDDVCDAYMKLIENIPITKGEVFNIGGHAVATQEEIVLKLISISGKGVKPYYKDKPKGLFEIHKQTVNSDKIKKVLKWAPKYNLDTGLKRTWDMWIDQQPV
jgi:CDP-glucose 4,6-dehydratase